jgi:magnesium chelatase family protein
MDMSVELSMPSFGLYGSHGETSEQIRERVSRTIAIQRKRYQCETFSYNGELSGKDMEKYCPIGEEELSFLKDFFEEEQCSMRRLTRIIRVARTIADSMESEDITIDHLARAISLRSINKKYWGGER